MKSKNILYLVFVFGIIVTAFLIWQFWPEGETLSPNPTPAPIVEDITNWQTYTNEEYGYEIKYPEIWANDKCAKTIVFGPKEKVEALKANDCSITMAKDLMFAINFRTIQQYEEIIVPFRKTDEDKNVVLDKIMVGDLEVEVPQYKTEYLRDASMGFKAGDIITDVIVPVENGYLEITLLDNQYIDIYNLMIDSSQFLYSVDDVIIE
ncbi:hypothetical protein KJ562_03045 [Patescibacteria group bacterium]|nr:hypothetical protein [Patescibacteria group bacterium]MBU4162146.1 hypothetical protein [Patescibacteria group bacterium]